MKFRSLFFASLIFLSSPNVFASPGRALKMTRLENGRIGFQTCDQRGCSGFGNPSGYTERDIQSMWNLNHAAAVADGTLGGVVLAGSVITGAFGGVIADGVIAPAGNFVAQLTGFAIGFSIPSGLAAGVGTLIKGLNPFYQWKKGTLKSSMKVAVTHLKKPGDSVYLIAASNDSALDRDQRITTDVLKRLPSDQTYTLARNGRSRAVGAQ